MKRPHAVPIALAVGAAAVAGTLAAARTTHLGQAAAPSVSNAEIARRTKAVKQTELALERALAKKPPKLPKLPTPQAATPVAPRPAAQTASAQVAGRARPAAPAAQRVFYVRPAPVVTTVPRSRGEDEGTEHEAGHEGDGGEVFDD